MKQAIFLIIDNGEDGRGKSTIIHAFTDEIVRDDILENHPNKNYYRSEDRIVDLTVHRKLAIDKLDGLDKLALDIEDIPKSTKAVLSKPIPRKKMCRDCHAQIGTRHTKDCVHFFDVEVLVLDKHCRLMPTKK